MSNKKNRTVVGINYLPDGTKEKDSCTAKNKAEAYMKYHKYKNQYDAIVVLDEDGEYVDETEL